MKTALYKISENISRYYRIMLLVTMLSSVVVAIAASQNSVQSIVTSQICVIYGIVHTVIFVLGLALMILGAALYAAAHIMPGQAKGSFQGYGMGMIIGGVIGVIIAFSAPYLLSLIAGSGANGYTASALCAAYP